MRIALAELKQESNTFSPFVTGLEAFEREGYLLRGEAITDRLWGTNTELGGAMQALKSAGVDAAPAFAAWALSGGPLTAAAHRGLAEGLIVELERLEPFDGLLLALHGSLVAEGCDDVEGALLSRLRERYGRGLPIVCSLDMHVNFTRAMLDAMDGCAVYQTNPHTDFADTGRRAAELLLHVLKGNLIEPCLIKLPWIIPPETSADHDEPMRTLLGMMRSIEAQPGIVAAGILPGQPWLDVDEVGAGAYVAADDAMLARREAIALAEACWAKRFELDTALVSIKEAIYIANKTPGLTVFSDCADSTTSGSAGDSTYVLSALLAANLTRPALVLVVDPHAAAAAAGSLNRHIQLSVGGRLDPVHNTPLSIEGEVLRSGEYKFTMQGQSFSGLEVELGVSAVLRCGQVYVLLTSRRVLTVDPGLYRCAGLEPAEAGIVVVKSPIMYRANYASLAARVVTIDAPGASPSDVTRLNYSKIRRPFFPWDRDLQLDLEQHVITRRELAPHATD